MDAAQPGHSPQTAAIAAGLVYAPLLLTAIPAGAASDNTDPRHLMRIATIVMLAFCALYPLRSARRSRLVRADPDRRRLGRVDPELRRGCPVPRDRDTTAADGTLLSHALRSTVNQAAVFGSPFVGLLLYRFGGVTAVLVGICALLAAATVILGLVPELERESEPIAVMRENITVGIASLRLNTRLRTIGWANLSWNIFAGAAIGIMPAVLREHLGMNEIMASATFIAGAIVVVLLTLPLVRTAQRRYGAVRTFIVAITIQATAIVLFADPRARSSGRSSTASSCSRTAPQPRRSTVRAPPRSSTTTRGS